MSPKTSKKLIKKNQKSKFKETYRKKWQKWIVTAYNCQKKGMFDLITVCHVMHWCGHCQVRDFTKDIRFGRSI